MYPMSFIIFVPLSSLNAPSHSLWSPFSEEGSIPLSCLFLKDPLSVIGVAYISMGVGLLLHHRQLTKGYTSEENSPLLPPPAPSHQLPEAAQLDGGGGQRPCDSLKLPLSLLFCTSRIRQCQMTALTVISTWK